MSTSEPYLLLLGGAYTQQGVRCVRQAKARGLRVWLTDTPDKLELAPTVVEMVDRVSLLPYTDPSACVAWAIAQARSTQFVGVFGFREYAVEAVAAVAHALGLPGNPPEAVRRVRNKFLCRQALAARGIVQPAIALCKNLQEALKFADAYPPGPWLVKPVSAMGSLGVSLVRTPNEWEQAMKHLGEASTSFIVECFQPGDEFSAEGLFVYNQPHILAFTRKLTMGAPHFVEQGHAMPQELDQAIVRRVTQTIITALEALELTWGLFHVEFWLDNGYPVLGEVHVRAGGDYIHFMIEQVTGIELYGAVFDQLLAYPLDSSAWQPHRGAAIRYLTPPPGRVTAIQGWEKVVSDPQCQLAELNLQVGDVVGPVHSSSDRPGYILVYDKTAESANLAAERLCNRIQIHTYGVDKPSTDI